MKSDSWVGRRLAVVMASGLGIGIGLIDRATPFGDDSSQFTVLLWLVSSGLLGFVWPRRPWVWAVGVGPWLSVLYLVLQALGRPIAIDPNTVTTSLILIPISLAVCAMGAYAGALVRGCVLPPSRPAGAWPGSGA